MDKRSIRNISIAFIVILTFIGFALIYVYINKRKLEQAELELITKNQEKIVNVESKEVDNDKLILEIKNNKILKSLNELFTYNDYTIYSYKVIDNDICSHLPLCEYKENKNEIKYYVLEKSTNKISLAMKMGSIEDNSLSDNLYYFYLDNADLGGIINIKEEKIVIGYNEFSCTYHSDERAVPCVKDKLTIVGKKTNDLSKYGVLSLEDFSLKLKLDYDSIYYLNDRKQFIIEKDNNNELLDINYNNILESSYDYIGYSKYIGYITIKDDKLQIYDNNLIEVNLEENKIDTIYNKALKNYKIEDEYAEKYLFILNSNSYFYNGGSFFMRMNFNNIYYFNKPDPNEINDEGKYIKYIGNKYNKEELIIYDQYGACNQNPQIYIINNNKTYKIPKEDFKTKAMCN